LFKEACNTNENLTKQVQVHKTCLQKSWLGPKLKFLKSSQNPRVNIPWYQKQNVNYDSPVASTNDIKSTNDKITLIDAFASTNAKTDIINDAPL
jgi:hypothetical protein